MPQETLSDILNVSIRAMRAISDEIRLRRWNDHPLVAQLDTCDDELRHVIDMFEGLNAETDVNENA